MTVQKSMQSGGTVRHLFLKPAHNDPMLPVSQVTAISGEGLQDDVSRGRRKRQVLLIEQETLHEFGLAPGELRENIVVHGLLLAGTAPKTHIHIGDAEIEVTMDCSPCDSLDRLRPGLQHAIRGRRGTLSKVVRSGIIQVGDAVSLTS